MLKWLRLGKNTLQIRLTTWYVLLLGGTLIFFSSYLYVQLQKSLLNQLDTSLLVTASQTLNDLIEEGGHPVFKQTVSSQAIAQRMTRAGFAVRLLSPNGEVWDGFGHDESLPLKKPKQGGYENLKEGDETWRVYNQLVRVPNEKIKLIAWLQVAQSLKPLSQVSQHLLMLMLIGFPLVLMIAGVGGFLLADRALAPINKIIDTAEAISPSDFTRRIGSKGLLDEVGRLATTFDRMLDRIELAFQREKRFTADASHELRTPLTVMKGRIGVTLSRPRSPEVYETTLHELEETVDHLIRLTNGLLFLARLEQEQYRIFADNTDDDPLQKKSLIRLSNQVDLSNLLSILVEQMQMFADTKKIQLISRIEPHLSLTGNPDYLTSLFLNLLDNAIKYTPEGREVRLEAYLESEQIIVHVINTGTEITPTHLPHLFERFYRAETARSQSNRGVGLGLAIAYEITRLHGGSIQVSCDHPQMISFTVIFPFGFSSKNC